MHVKTNGIEDVENLVLTACLENQAYDSQCEGGRADWLHEMFKGTVAYAKFSDVILSALACDNEDCDLEQLCELAAQMGSNGDDRAAIALRCFVWSQPRDATSSGMFGARAIILLDGFPALVKIASLLGENIKEKPDEYVDSLDCLTEDRLDFDESHGRLKRLAVEDDNVAAYVARVQRDLDEKALQTQRTPEQETARLAAFRDNKQREYTVERIVAAAANHDSRSKGVYSIFGRWASVEALQSILLHLEQETNPETCKRLLWVFSKAELPQFDKTVWALAHAGDEELRAAAVRALASMQDPRIRELGRQRLRNGNFLTETGEEIELFVKNYQTGDEALILDALHGLTPNDDAAHAIGMSVQRVCAHIDTPALAGLAEWIYWTNPCSLCRKDAVELLLNWNCMPEDIAEECRHDALLETRALMRQRV